MAKNNSGLVLGLGALGVAGVGAYFYLKDKDMLPKLNFSSDGSSVAQTSSAPSTFGINEYSVEDVKPSNDALVENMRSDGETYLQNNPGAFGGNSSSGSKSGPSGGSYSLVSSITSSGKIIPTISVSSNNSPSQNVSIGSSLNAVRSNGNGTSDAGVMTVSSGSSNKSSSGSIVSRVANTLASPVNNVKKVLSRFF